MKTLQNNFTTPEQSKRLMELGVPVDSADCYYYDWNIIDEEDCGGYCPQIFDWYEISIKKFEERKCVKMYPCWSVGRLIKIHETCTSCLFERRYTKLSVLEDVLAQIEEDIMATDECWDFSKLEE